MYEYNGEGGELEEAMHFPILESNGGVYDDDSFVAGWNLCVLDMKLSDAARFDSGVIPPQRLPIEYYEQIDLLAMRYGFLVTVHLLADDEEIADFAFTHHKKDLHD